MIFRDPNILYKEEEEMVELWGVEFWVIHKLGKLPFYQPFTDML